jgi:hypothetical protein
MSSLPGYDAWRTGGRYRSSLGYVTCPGCDEATAVTYEEEYGAGSWTPEECKYCGRAFEGDEAWEDDDGPDPDRAYDLMREEELG